MRAVKIEASSTVATAVTVDGLDDVQAQVGGYVTPITIMDGAHLLVDEDGGTKGLSLNMVASLLAGEPIVGDALVIGVGPDDWIDDPDILAKTNQLLEDKVDDHRGLMAPCSPFVDHRFQPWAAKCLAYCGTPNPDFDPNFDPWEGHQ